MIFGCYDKNIYCLNFDGKSLRFSLAWKCTVDGQIFSTPKVFDSTILVCTTNGIITTIRDGVIHRRWEMNGECFSTPVICNQGYAFVGCRNNFVYCFDLND